MSKLIDDDGNELKFPGPINFSASGRPFSTTLVVEGSGKAALEKLKEFFARANGDQTGYRFRDTAMLAAGASMLCQRGPERSSLVGEWLFPVKPTPESIVAEARSWMDTPWHHAQSVKGVGCDCIGLLVGVARHFGLDKEWLQNGRQFHAYSIDPDPTKLLAACRLFFDPIPVSQAGLGDILLFRLIQHPKHFGIISKADPLTIIHAYKTAERVTEMPINDVWRRRIHSAWRYKGV